MINADMRLYDYFTIGEKNAYGQATIPAKDADPVGKVKMAINITSQSTQDNINYKDANYIGLTHANVDDTYIIRYGNERLKVLYVNPLGRFKQVFMKGM
jgi:hypothetical protein